MKNFKFVILFVVMLFSKEGFSQVNFDCGTVHNASANNLVSSPFEGFYKPNRTDTLNGVPLPEGAYFPVLVVFVQFKNEPIDPRHTWDTNSAPIYLDNLFPVRKKPQEIGGNTIILIPNQYLRIGWKSVEENCMS